MTNPYDMIERLTAIQAAPADWDEYRTGQETIKAAIQVIGELADEIERLRAERWIPVAERLPESTMWYLIVICRKDRPDFRWVDFKIFDKAAGAFVISGSEHFTITHWQPLPEGPEAE